MFQEKKNRRSMYLSSYKLLVLMGLIVFPQAAMGYVQHPVVVTTTPFVTRTLIVESANAGATTASTTAFVRRESATGPLAFQTKGTTTPSPHHHRVTYDMGLGKNPSLAERKNRATATSTSLDAHGSQELLGNGVEDKIQEAAQHWTDYEAVRDFPSPRRQQAPVAAASTQSIADNNLQSNPSTPLNSGPTSATKKPKAFPTLKPQRSASDVLQIRSHRVTTEKQNVDSSDASWPFISRVAAMDTSMIDQNHDQQQLQQQQTNKDRVVQLDPNTIWVEMLLHHQLEQQQLQQALASAN